MSDALANLIEQEAEPLGVVPGLSNDRYHAGPGISKSGLDLIDRCPALYYARYLDPKRPPEKERGGQLTGTLAHSAILEPDQFDSTYMVGPDCRKNTNEWKSRQDIADSLGKVMISPDEYDLAMKMTEAARKNPEVDHLLGRGKAEQSCYWRDPGTGVLVRCRPDHVHDTPDGDILVDVKTFDNTALPAIKRQIRMKRYDVQDALYSDGWAFGTGRSVRAFVFVFIKVEWPHLTRAVMLDDPIRDRARKAYQTNLETYHECLGSGEWPGHSNAIELIED